MTRKRKSGKRRGDGTCALVWIEVQSLAVMKRQIQNFRTNLALTTSACFCAGIPALTRLMFTFPESPL
ncbi:MAG: hypothetical protein LBJ67_16155 [Planctomycetaceae bacterium]|nr:hypothetical protein [Planctomycetaceae bacterium]